MTKIVSAKNFSSSDDFQVTDDLSGYNFLYIMNCYYDGFHPNFHGEMHPIYPFINNLYANEGLWFSVYRGDSNTINKVYIKYNPTTKTWNFTPSGQFNDYLIIYGVKI
jgi:hypothetical protein